jgi:hypothetical protein
MRGEEDPQVEERKMLGMKREEDPHGEERRAATHLEP